MPSQIVLWSRCFLWNEQCELSLVISYLHDVRIGIPIVLCLKNKSIDKINHIYELKNNKA